MSRREIVINGTGDIPGSTPGQLTMWDVSRFWSKVKKTKRCWLWTACLNGGGYGYIRINKVGKVAHRVCYELHFGSIPKGKILRHTCDNPRCVRPSHLIPGTQQQNVDDMWSRGRGKSPIQKRTLTDRDLLKIHTALKRGNTTRVIAKQFGVSQPLIVHIKHGRKAYGRRLKAALKRAG